VRDKLNHGLSRKVTDLVIGFQADFGIVVNPTQHPDLVIKVLAKDEVGLWVGQKTPLSRLKGDSNVLIYDPDLLQCQWLLKQLKRKGWQFGRTLESSNLEVITALVAQGSGVGILPGRVATKDPHLGLRSIAGSPKFQDKVCLIYRADAQKSKAAKTLISRIAKCL
jgi:LysR family transcriptional regulator, cell division regulator